MDECGYEEILKDAGVEINEYEKNTWKPLLRQLMISCAVWCIYFMQGLYLGAPTVMVAQIRREANSTDAVSDEMSSWLSSLPAISALPLILIVPWSFYKLGRKYTYIIISLLEMIAFIIFYNSTELYHILISQVFIGASTAAVNTCVPILIAEYSSPKYRGIFLTFKSASTFWGIWVSNALGTYFHWKNIALVGFLCCIYLVTVFAWPESPYWLAMKGRYQESAKSHRWLKGVNEISEKELANIISYQKKSKTFPPASDNIMDYRSFSNLSKVWVTISSRLLYKPMLICMVLLAQYQFSGKMVISVYALEILKRLTKDESVAYKSMLILDGITVFSMYVGCILSRYFKRRTLLFCFGGTGILILYILSFYLYLVSFFIIQENYVIVVSLLTAYSIAIGCGPMILGSSIYGEIVPSRYQSPIMIIAGLFIVAVMSTLLKISPFLFRILKMHGCFTFFSISSTVNIVILYHYLPETKDKTMYEIEEYFSDKQKSSEQSEILLQTKK